MAAVYFSFLLLSEIIHVTSSENSCYAFYPNWN